MAETGIREVFEGDIRNRLKKTELGYLFQQDICDLFGSLMISLKLVKHKKRMSLQKFNHCFLGRDAVQSLASLKLYCSTETREALNHPSDLTPPTAKLPENSALIIMQHLLDGCLIKDPSREYMLFDQRDIYTPTEKGLRVLEEFIQRFRLESEADHLVATLSTQPTPRSTLIHLPRQKADDKLVVTQTLIRRIFRHLVGRLPNAGVKLASKNKAAAILKKQIKQDLEHLRGKLASEYNTHCIEAPNIIHWICKTSTVSCPYEAAHIAAHMVRFGLLVLLSIQSEAVAAGKVTKFTVAGPVPRGSDHVTPTADFFYSKRTLYAITVHGSFIAGWSDYPTTAADFDLVCAIQESKISTKPIKEEPLSKSNAARLKRSVTDPAWLLLFREFLREQGCENDISFWLDVEDFKTEFEAAQIAVLSSKESDVEILVPVQGSSSNPFEPPVEVLVPVVQGSSSSNPFEPSLTPENPHERLGNRPFLLFNTYIQHSSAYQLSFDVGADLKEELYRGLQHCVDYVTNQIMIQESDNTAGSIALHVEQLEILLWMYERIQNRVFCVMADDYIPKFMKWPKFIDARLQRKKSLADKHDVPSITIADKGKGKATS